MKITYKFIIVSIFAVLMMAEVRAQFSVNQPVREMRAVWLTTVQSLDWPRTKATSPEGVEKQKKELTDMLDQLAAANFNTIIFQTRTRAAVLYPSKIETWDQCLTGRFGQDPGYDPLQFAVEECHKRGMQIHAWLVALPANKAANSKAMGSMALEKRKPSLVIKTTNTQGETAYMLDPGVPETADYLASICEEIVANYDIDGINFDYIRYPEKELRYSDAATYRKYGKGQSLADWRRDNVTRCVRTVHDRVKAIKPWVAISCSPVGKYADTQRASAGGWNARDAVYQDAKLWMQEGSMDYLMPMMYFKGNHFFPFALDWKEGTSGPNIATGLGVYMIDKGQKDWPASVMISEINFGRDNGLGGQAYFRTRFLTDNTKGIYDMLRKDIYATKALVPPMVNGVESVSLAKEVNLEVTQQTLCYTWDSVANCTYNIYRCDSYPVDITRAANLYKTNLREPQLEVTLPLSQHWLPYYVVTAINRYGVESEPIELNRPHEFVDVSEFIPAFRKQ